MTRHVVRDGAVEAHVWIIRFVLFKYYRTNTRSPTIYYSEFKNRLADEESAFNLLHLLHHLNGVVVSSVRDLHRLNPAIGSELKHYHRQRLGDAFRLYT